jgi:hypothetical protein
MQAESPITVACIQMPRAVGTQGPFKGFYALAAFLLGQLAKLRLNVKAGMRATDDDELVHGVSYAPPKLAFLTIGELGVPVTELNFGH